MHTLQQICHTDKQGDRPCNSCSSYQSNSAQCISVSPTWTEGRWDSSRAVEGAPLGVPLHGVGTSPAPVALTAALLSMWEGRLSWCSSRTACSHNRMAAQKAPLCMHLSRG